jgi:signal transduction histidine kinase
VNAFAGEVQTEISDLTEPENEFERGQWSRLIETYTPVRKVGTSTVVAVSEFYQMTEDLEREVRAAQMRSWLVVSAATIVMYLLLTALVGRASNTIIFQQSELRDKVAQLSTVLMQNEQLHKRVSRAAARTTSLNERFLGRITADLHDGPGQDLALALLRIDELAGVCATCKVSITNRRAASDDFGTIESALKSALADMRAILAGLRLPEIGQLSITETAERAVRDYERKTSAAVELIINDVPVEAPLSVKITLYRILQESLANGFRHADGASQRVSIAGKEGQLIIEISDDGPGFEPRSVLTDGHLGLIGMRERVEILAGTFEVKSAPNNGTLIRAHLPLTLLEVDDE